MPYKNIIKIFGASNLGNYIYDHICKILCIISESLQTLGNSSIDAKKTLVSTPDRKLPLHKNLKVLWLFRFTERVPLILT